MVREAKRPRSRKIPRSQHSDDAARSSHHAQSSLLKLLDLSAAQPGFKGSFDSVGIRFADANFAQDDKT
jgi:hypothetical protein